MRKSKGRHSVPVTTLERPEERLSAFTALAAFGASVYAVRLADGLVKIGWTENLGRRKQHFGAAAELLGFQPGSRETENALHHSLRASVAHGREYYHATPEVLAVVNDMRADFNLPPLTA